VPLDVDTIIRSAEQTGRLLVVDNAGPTAGERRDRRTGSRRPVRNRSIRFERMGLPRRPADPRPALEKEFYPSPAKIAAAAYRLVRPGDENWSPDLAPSRAELQVQFRGPF